MLGLLFKHQRKTMPSIQHQDYKGYAIVAMSTPAGSGKYHSISLFNRPSSPSRRTTVRLLIKRTLLKARPSLPKQRRLMQRTIGLERGLKHSRNKNNSGHAWHRTISDFGCLAVWKHYARVVYQTGRGSSGEVQPDIAWLPAPPPQWRYAVTQKVANLPHSPRLVGW